MPKAQSKIPSWASDKSPSPERIRLHVRVEILEPGVMSSETRRSVWDQGLNHKKKKVLGIPRGKRETAMQVPWRAAGPDAETRTARSSD